MSTINLSDDQMQALVAKAMFEGMTDEQKSQMITSAIQASLTKPRGDRAYGEKRSEFQIAFDTAVYTVTNRIALEMIESDESFRAQLKGLFADAAAKLFDKEAREPLVTEIAELIRRGLSKDRY